MQKNLSQLFFILAFLLLTGFWSNAQQICMVTADHQDAENYIVLWEGLADVSTIDSIFIYRKAVTETVFS